MLAINQLVGSQQDVAVILGDQQISGKNFLVRGVDVSMSQEQIDIETLGGMKHYIPGVRTCDIDIRLTSLGDTMFVSLIEDMNVGDKVVRNATIPELLFAARKKIEEGR